MISAGSAVRFCCSRGVHGIREVLHVQHIVSTSMHPQRHPGLLRCFQTMFPCRNSIRCTENRAMQITARKTTQNRGLMPGPVGYMGSTESRVCDCPPAGDCQQRHGTVQEGQNCCGFGPVQCVEGDESKHLRAAGDRRAGVSSDSPARGCYDSFTFTLYPQWVNSVGPGSHDLRHPWKQLETSGCAR